MEDPSYRSPPQKKFSSPKRNSVMANSKTGSPSKHVAPFGKPIEIIKSKYYNRAPHMVSQNFRHTFARFEQINLPRINLCR